MLTRPVSSENKSNASIDIESGLETTKESQNLRKSTFVFGSVTLVVSLGKDCSDSGKRCINDGMRDSHKIDPVSSAPTIYLLKVWSFGLKVRHL